MSPTNWRSRLHSQRTRSTLETISKSGFVDMIDCQWDYTSDNMQVRIKPKRPKRVRHLAPLRSISDAYRSSDHLSSKSNRMEAIPYVPRQGIETAVRDSAAERTTGSGSQAAVSQTLTASGTFHTPNRGALLANSYYSGFAPEVLRAMQGVAPLHPPITFDPRNYLTPAPSTQAPMPAAPAPIKRETKVGEIIAWRCWRLTSNGKRLQSTYMNNTWLPDKPMRGDPKDSSAGVHAAKDRSYAENFARGRGRIVVGKVSLYGNIVEHEWGYRAEYAKVHSIDDVIDDYGCTIEPQKQAIIQKLQRTYGANGHSLHTSRRLHAFAFAIAIMGITPLLIGLAKSNNPTHTGMFVVMMVLAGYLMWGFADALLSKKSATTPTGQP